MQLQASLHCAFPLITFDHRTKASPIWHHSRSEAMHKSLSSGERVQEVRIRFSINLWISLAIKPLSQPKDVISSSQSTLTQIVVTSVLPHSSKYVHLTAAKAAVLLSVDVSKPCFANFFSSKLDYDTALSSLSRWVIYKSNLFLAEDSPPKAPPFHPS